MWLLLVIEQIDNVIHPDTSSGYEEDYDEYYDAFVWLKKYEKVEMTKKAPVKLRSGDYSFKYSLLSPGEA